MNDFSYKHLQYQAMALTQALLGAISPNFRIAWVTKEGKKVIVNIILEKEDAEDREEIDDMYTEFEILQQDKTEFEFRVMVSDGDIGWPDASSSIVVYRRKE